MTVFTVYARRPLPQADPLEFVFVKEGFCWPALFVPIPWLIFRKMGWALIFYLLAFAGLAVLDRFLPSSGAISGLGLLFSWLFALEANQLRSDSLTRSGYQMVGVAEGGDLVEAEIRFFSGLESPSPLISPPFPNPSGAAPRRLPAETVQPVIGLFPAPRGQA